ncbi:hypothetical protein CEXT_84311 [Caerostris extrusa]|uniref:Uncharacterized protein n=1 Tax=Caerostris extrusa TaxID=172846 RepID=A0AAV4R664_CAEEX|nr:hypothetical protein CEXT_84311 [Caerostris extrusa]
MYIGTKSRMVQKTKNKHQKQCICAIRECPILPYPLECTNTVLCLRCGKEAIFPVLNSHCSADGADYNPFVPAYWVERAHPLVFPLFGCIPNRKTLERGKRGKFPTTEKGA